MRTYKGKTLEELTAEELKEYSILIDSTISQLTQELNSHSRTKSNQAGMRLPVWENSRTELDHYLKQRNN
ncbi:hypothetical protein BBN09_10780 [Vibrio parahaemolyticus]|jgi:hypothetical protein|nr:hypothetical protein BBN09_10780 [Vibrio parahaemolyticus]